jgi:lipid-A-disaccharide synthase
LERNACREFLQDECTPQTLATALGELIVNGPARTAQEQAWSDLRQIMHVGDQESPSSKAAKIVLASLSKR